MNEINDLSNLDISDFDMRFSPPLRDGAPQVFMEQVEPKLKDIAAMLVDNLSDSRERSLALTKLEESYHWMLMATLHMPDGWLEPEKREVHPMSESDRAVVKTVLNALEMLCSMFDDENKASLAITTGTLARDLTEVFRRM